MKVHVVACSRRQHFSPITPRALFNKTHEGLSHWLRLATYFSRLEFADLPDKSSDLGLKYGKLREALNTTVPDLSAIGMQAARLATYYISPEQLSNHHRGLSD